MSVQLDWQQDLEDGWPRRQEYGPPPGGIPSWMRWVLLAVAIAVIGGGVAFWRLSSTGLRAAKEDVQESLELSQWALQQGDQELYRRQLDPTVPGWQDHVLEQWNELVAAAQDTPAPEIEQIKLRGDVAETTLRWQDGRTAESYLARRWFRLVNSQWLWTQPQREGWGAERSETRPNLTLSFYTADGEVVVQTLNRLNELVGQLCQQYQISGPQCHIHLAWKPVDDAGRPLGHRDLPLPPLATSTADDMDGSLYVLGATDAAMQSHEVRDRLRTFHPGRAFVAQSRLDVIRPEGADVLPGALPGDPAKPIVLPTPWLLGIAPEGLPHPDWFSYVERVLEDAVMRRASGVLLGSADYVNAAWALRQAILASEHGVPTAQQMAAPGPAAPHKPLPVSFPDLSRLGAALQEQPDEVALTHLADLSRYLQARWTQADLAALTSALGEHAFTGPLLRDVLDIEEEDFEREWRQQQFTQEGAPLAAVFADLRDLMRAEAEAWAGDDRSDTLESVSKLYTGPGLQWRAQAAADSPLSAPLVYGPDWTVEFSDFGLIEETLWVEVEERVNGEAVADLRFYRWDEEIGWRRERPDERFWGEALETNTELVHWRYHEADAALIAALVDLVDQYVQAAQTKLNLTPAHPVTLTVSPDTIASWNIATWPELAVPSPRNYDLETTDGPGEALRRDVAVSLAIAYMSELSDHWEETSLQPPGNDAWAVLVATIRSLLQQWQVPDEPLFADFYRSLASALRAGTMPGAFQLALARPDYDQVTMAGRTLVAAYVLDRHGWEWLQPLMEQGLASTLEAVLEAEGRTMEALESDWQNYLVQQQLDR